MSQVSHDQVDLMLRLYEMRREPRLRQAREWFMRNFFPETAADRASLKSDEDASFRMVTSYWEMVGSLLKRGMVDEELFFECTGEFWFVWDRLKPLANEMRLASKDPHLWDNLEKMAVRYEHWRERRAPGSIAAVRERIQKARAAAVSSR